MNLSRTEAFFEIIQSSEATSDGVIKSFLAQYLAVILYSEMEEKVAELVRDHLGSFTHSAVAAFISNSMAELIKRLPKSDIAKLAGRFGEDFKQKLNENLDERSVTLYNNIIAARHEVGHRIGSNVTLDEIGKGIEAANYILARFAKCLGELGVEMNTSKSII